MNTIEIDKIYRGGHVFYFEPNDTDLMGKDQDGQDVALMPHLEDLCISMTLTAEMCPRKRKQIPTLNQTDKNEIFTRSLSWISYVNGIKNGTNVNQQIINAGVKLNDEKYLTTYYTEISADNYIDHELVEGLGVTSVNISYESWYTPTITINFVDVHGSSLWGREEAIHDSDGTINSDNLLGVFFQQPYPLFRLQVKGFLGREVTYQLSISSFKGRYNSQTGNFEVTVTFIGYSYSLLTDIPLKMLSYVSEMSYVGKRYWDKHCESKEWEMKNADGTTTKPIKLYQFIRNIKSAIRLLNEQDAKNCEGIPDGTSSTNDTNDYTSDDRTVSLAENQNVTEAINGLSAIEGVESALNGFIEACRVMAEDTYGGKMIIGKEVDKKNNINKEQLLLIMANADGDRSATSICTAYKSLVSALNSYNSENPKKKIENAIGKSVPSMKIFWEVSTANKAIIKPARIFKIVNNTVTGYHFNLQRLTEFKINNIKLNNDTASQLKSLIHTVSMPPYVNSKNGNGFGEYAELYDLGDMRSRVAIIKKELSAVGTNTENRVESESASKSNSNEKINTTNSDNTSNTLEETRKKKVRDIVGFEPTIGNFVKMVMCHLETFVEVMMHCGDQIYLDLEKRTPQNFKISLDNTDIPDNDKNSVGDAEIYPWPALYNPNPKNNNENSETVFKEYKYEALGYTNDYPPISGGVEWEEQKVLTSAIEAIKRYGETAQTNPYGITNIYTCLPMTGSDLLTPSPFIEVIQYCKDVESMSPYIGLRIANLIGVGDSNCNATDAEAIGYMDALNLIGCTNDYEQLKKVITSKATNQDFASQVISYLTCQNTVKQTSQSEKGNTYNLFEFLKNGDGNKYNTNRHPIFIKQDGGNFTYSYIYSRSVNDNGVVSLVPTELYPFTGSNTPYLNTVFEKTSFPNGDSTNTTFFVPKVNSPDSSISTSQWFTYVTNTNIVLPNTEDSDYTNNQLFSIIKEDDVIEGLLQQIDSLSNGGVIFKDYDVEDDTLSQSFIDRRFRVSKDDYYEIYCNSGLNYNVLIPKISKVDETYYNGHLYFPNNTSNNVKLNSDWSTNTSSKLYKKLGLSVKDGGSKFKNGKTEYDLSDVMIGELPIMTNSSTRCSLFGSQLYYQQNDISDISTRNKAKAYLVLSSLMAGIDITKKKFKNGIFKVNNTSIIDYLPPFYLLFIGALLWRKHYYEENKKDPINLDGFAYDHDFEKTLISISKKILYVDTANKIQCYGISDYYMKYDSIDVSVRNTLIREFESFVNGNFRLIINTYELKDKDKKLINKAKWNTLKAMWSTNNFDPTSPSQWLQLFSTLNGYSSISTTKGNTDGLRLLMSESDTFTTANLLLKQIYGINGGYIVGRATTKRVGEETKTEVTVTSEQMMGYLKGFEKRINDLKDTSDANISEKESVPYKDTERDMAISYYYSLKHLWDSWLISCARDQFTIKNFFNKYFVFIDSFYENMYNTIKLNCEKIVDAYDTENINVLSFISKVTSDERCILFALPTFLDSNILDNGMSTVGAYKSKNTMSFKKENLRGIFKPYSYNEIGVPQPNNMFVFVYTHPYSSNACENTNKRFDSYMINDENSWPSVLKEGVFSTNNDEGADSASENNSLIDDNDELISARYAYYMPSFGISVNRANNHIFKSINVNMDSPLITAVAAQTYEDILTKYGKDSTKRIFFHGQDIFNIYSQYAYSCEVEMLGCAQIQPLMYFQLLNIPMWRGTYMIYKVTHDLQPGTMSTKFTGIKMSRRQSPYASGYYTIPKNNSNSDKTSQSNGGNGSSDSSATTNQDIVTYAKSFLVSGENHGKCAYSSSGPRNPLQCSADCSSFVQHVFKHVMGIDIGGSVSTQLDKAIKNDKLVWHNDGKPSAINMSVLQEGDILFNQHGNAKTTWGVGHATIYIGDGKCISWGRSGSNQNPFVNNVTVYNNKYVAVARYACGTVASDSTSVTTDSLTPSSETSQKKNKITDGICVVGDSWANGLKDFFQYGYVQNGVNLSYVKKTLLPQALKTTANIIVLCCGFNDIANTNGLSKFYSAMGEQICLSGKKCYVCTFPSMSPSWKYSYAVSRLNQEILNGTKSISGYLYYTAIQVPDSISKDNIGAGGYHLKSYKPLADFIHKTISN